VVAAGSKTQMGGTMRLGTRRTLLKTSACHAAGLYNSQTVDERSPPLAVILSRFCGSMGEGGCCVGDIGAGRGGVGGCVGFPGIGIDMR
jgi:hypothetical protein